MKDQAEFPIINNPPLHFRYYYYIKRLNRLIRYLTIKLENQAHFLQTFSNLTI